METYCLHHQGFLYPEDGGSTFLCNQTTWSPIPGDSNIRGHHCENCKSHISQGFSFTTLFTISAVVEWLTVILIYSNQGHAISCTTQTYFTVILQYKSLDAKQCISAETGLNTVNISDMWFWLRMHDSQFLKYKISSSHSKQMQLSLFRQPDVSRWLQSTIRDWYGPWWWTQWQLSHLHTADYLRLPCSS